VSVLATKARKRHAPDQLKAGFVKRAAFLPHLPLKEVSDVRIKASFVIKVDVLLGHEELAREPFKNIFNKAIHGDRFGAPPATENANPLNKRSNSTS
jgi:hypothetical protein